MDKAPLRAAIIESLLCCFDVDLGEVADRRGCHLDSLTADLGALAPLVAAGWIAIDGNRLRITRHRHEVARVAASAFDAYLGKGSRHSAAV